MLLFSSLFGATDHDWTMHYEAFVGPLDFYVLFVYGI